ncbi:MAG: tRNA (guanosine(37)-N1)-methyltransferase TrmD [Defluviitaleaceae bacterium]|nr:tRNA (guanosine(37)-N1)-methyltransferase TrmD [Defluviitaleaceae bacterium]MCL2275198.1 tRNA (guanosine(37)-N1)-methyltransferase TrmD [Defluviitaleaceae bacterium]
MTFYVLTLFPEMIQGMAGYSILGRAVTHGHICVNAINIRDFAVNKYGQVDDAPYGGGAGMVMMAQPVYDAWAHTCETMGALPYSKKTRTIYLSPQGKPLTQAIAEELARERSLILLCGHYEGIDERVIEEIVTDEISIGDYILTGGEPAALVLMDAVSRLVPNVLNKEASHQDESFGVDLQGGLEYPHYTRPPIFRGREVPDILLSGHHGKIAEWRKIQSRQRTQQKRPDLLV